MADILNPRLMKFNEELLIDVKLTEMNIKDKTLACPGLKAKWLRLMFEERKLLSRMQELKKQKIEEYVANHGLHNIPKIKTIDEAQKSDEINKLEKTIFQQKELVDYLEQANKIMMNLNFDIKNAIDIIKMENI